MSRQEPPRVTDEELEAFLEVHNRDLLSSAEIERHERNSVRLAPRLAAELRALRAREQEATPDVDAIVDRLLDIAAQPRGAPEAMADVVRPLVAARDELAALRAPVDVERAATEACQRYHATPVDHSGLGTRDKSAWRAAVAPIVERAAALAREAEALRAEIKRVIRERDHAQANFESVDRNRDLVASDLATARAEIERPKAELAVSREPGDGMGAPA